MLVDQLKQNSAKFRNWLTVPNFAQQTIFNWTALRHLHLHELLMEPSRTSTNFPGTYRCTYWELVQPVRHIVVALWYHKILYWLPLHVSVRHRAFASTWDRYFSWNRASVKSRHNSFRTINSIPKRMQTISESYDYGHQWKAIPIHWERYSFPVLVKLMNYTLTYRHSYLDLVCTKLVCYSVEIVVCVWMTKKKLTKRLSVVGGNALSNNLRFGSQTTLTNQECLQSFDSRFVQTSSICARAVSTQSACFGDIGGPLVIQYLDTWIQIGIASTINPAGCHGPVVYTRLTSYIDWIRTMTGITNDFWWKYWQESEREREMIKINSTK